MAKQDTNDTQNDVFPRDQLEHYKLELTRLRTENEHLTTEVDYLRQALAAALSKVPQIEAPASSDPDALQAQSEEMGSSLGTYVKYFSLASLMASPVALLILLMLGLICTIVFFVVLYLLL